MSLEIQKSISALGNSLAYAYGAFTGIKDSQEESTPPVGSKDQYTSQVGATVNMSGLGMAGLGGMPLIIIGLLIYFMTRR